MLITADKDVSLPYEEIYRGHEIYIEKNPDTFREDLLDWTVCKDNVILEEDSTYNAKDALAEAYLAIDSLVSPK